MYFAKNLRKLRKDFGLTQEELAKMLNLSKSNISKYENEELEPPLKTLIEIAKLFKTPIHELIGVPEIPISPRNDYINDFKKIDNQVVEATFEKYIDQFSSTILERFSDDEPEIKALVAVTLDFTDDLLNTHQKDELKNILVEIEAVTAKYIQKRLAK